MAWALLGNERALPASLRLVSGPTALVARPCPLLGQAPSLSLRSQSRQLPGGNGFLMEVTILHDGS